MKLYDFYRGKKGSITENIQSASEVEKQYIEENLHKWFKEKWVRFGPDGKIRGDCARGDDSEGKPKCLPRAKAHALGKKGRKYAAAKKRREDPNPERSGAAINVQTKKETNEERHLCPECGGPIFEFTKLEEKKDACYYKVKSRYKVWPSAYASGALVKCRKKGAKNWGTKSESQHSFNEQQTVVPKIGPKGETVVAPVLPAEQEDFERMMRTARANTEANRENTVLARRGDPQAYRAADSSSAPASGASQSRSVKSASVDPSKARLTSQDLGDDEKWEKEKQKILFPNTTRSSGTVRQATAQEIAKATAAGIIPPTTARPTAAATTATAPATSAATRAPSRPATPAVPSSQTFAQAFAAARANAGGPGGVFTWTDSNGVTRQYQTNIRGEQYLPASQLRTVSTIRQATRESSTNMYFNVSGTDRKTLIHEFKLQHDNRGWFLGEGASSSCKLDAIRAFGMPLTEEEMNQAAYSGTAATLGVDNPKSPIGSISKSQRLNKRSRSK